jgi:hypothetical protein
MCNGRCVRGKTTTLSGNRGIIRDAMLLIYVHGAAENLYECHPEHV